MKKKRIYILNGPNLAQLGSREIDVYGAVTFNDYFQQLCQRHPEVELSYFQTDEEQLLASKIANCTIYDGIILNAGAYTHTSIVLSDAIRATFCPVIEVHISNIFGREHFRRESTIASACRGSISGFGLESYHVAIEAIKTITD